MSHTPMKLDLWVDTDGDEASIGYAAGQDAWIKLGKSKGVDSEALALLEELLACHYTEPQNFAAVLYGALCFLLEVSITAKPIEVAS